MAFNIMYSFPLFEAGKPKREWGNNLVSHVFVINLYLCNEFFLLSMYMRKKSVTK